MNDKLTDLAHALRCNLVLEDLIEFQKEGIVDLKAENKNLIDELHTRRHGDKQFERTATSRSTDKRW